MIFVVIYAKLMFSRIPCSPALSRSRISAPAFTDTRRTPYHHNYSGMADCPCGRKKVVAITGN
jgi:hypothetical protein